MSKKNDRKSVSKSKSTTSKRGTPTPRTTVAKPVTPAVKVEAPVVAKPVVETPEAAKPVVEAQVTPVVATPAAVTEVAAAPAVDVEAIIGRLRDTYAEHAIEAVDALASINDARSISALIDVLYNSDGYFHTVTRSAAAMALGRIGATNAVDALQFASRDAVAEVSTEAILALGQLKAASTTLGLIEIVQNASGFYLNVTRHAAIRALGRIGDASARETLSNVANNGWEDAALVAAANEALTQI